MQENQELTRNTRKGSAMPEEVDNGRIERGGHPPELGKNSLATSISSAPARVGWREWRGGTGRAKGGVNLARERPELAHHGGIRAARVS